MSRESLLILVGVLVILSPFIGLPGSLLAWVLPVLGGVVIAVGVLLKRERSPEAPHETSASLVP